MSNHPTLITTEPYFMKNPEAHQVRVFWGPRVIFRDPKRALADMANKRTSRRLECNILIAWKALACAQKISGRFKTPWEVESRCVALNRPWKTKGDLDEI